MLEKTDIPLIPDGYPLVVAMNALMDAVKSVSRSLTIRRRPSFHGAEGGHAEIFMVGGDGGTITAAGYMVGGLDSILDHTWISLRVLQSDVC